MSGNRLEERVKELIRDWGVVVHNTLETQSSFIAFGTLRVTTRREAPPR
jgi:hypothetical protein